MPRSHSTALSIAPPSPCVELRVVFMAPAGARRGMSHLHRCVSLAQVLGVRPLVAVRGLRAAREAALTLGVDVIPTGSCQVLDAIRPDVVVIDDPSMAHTERWTAAARRLGAVVVTIDPLDDGSGDADLVIDSHLTREGRASRPGLTLVGPSFTVSDTAVMHDRSTADRLRRVVISTGTGAVDHIAATMATAFASADPRADVRMITRGQPTQTATGYSAIEPAPDAAGDVSDIDMRMRWLAVPSALGRLALEPMPQRATVPAPAVSLSGPRPVLAFRPRLESTVSVDAAGPDATAPGSGLAELVLLSDRRRRRRQANPLDHGTTLTLDHGDVGIDNAPLASGFLDSAPLKTVDSL